MSEIDKKIAQSNIGYNEEYITEILKGNVKNHSMMNAMGEKETMGVTVSGEDICRFNELTPAPTSTVLIPTPD